MLRQPQISYTIVSSAAIILLACVGDPYLSSYTKAKPNESDLTGTWVPDKETAKAMRERGGYSTDKGRTSLTLRSDGTFTMVDMPDWWRSPFGTSHGRFESASGTWKLKEHSPGTAWEIELDFPTWWTSIPIRGQKQPYLMHFALGDPDNGEAMTFVMERSSDH